MIWFHFVSVLIMLQYNHCWALYGTWNNKKRRVKFKKLSKPWSMFQPFGKHWIFTMIFTHLVVQQTYLKNCKKIEKKTIFPLTSQKDKLTKHEPLTMTLLLAILGQKIRRSTVISLLIISRKSAKCLSPLVFTSNTFLRLKYRCDQGWPTSCPRTFCPMTTCPRDFAPSTSCPTTSGPTDVLPHWRPAPQRPFSCNQRRDSDPCSDQKIFQLFFRNRFSPCFRTLRLF